MLQDCVLDFSSDLKFELSFTQELCILIDSPKSHAVFLLIKYKEFNQLMELTLNPEDYEDPQHFADDYLVLEVLRKSPNLDLGIDRAQVAVTSFFTSEARCKSSNDRLYGLDTPPPFMEAVRLKVLSILGTLTTKDLQFVEDNFKFGPGATTGVKGSGCVLSDKYDEEIHLTTNLIPFYRSILGDRWWESLRNPVIVEGNRFTTVPKSAKTDRGICIEPTLNIYTQLGVGALIRKKLKRVSIDLDSQERNRFLASKAEKWNLCTIDLAAASDTLSCGCVSRLVPPQWLTLLDLLRSEKSDIDGKTVLLEKFSSMGNGFTFELESLIFTAVVQTCVPKSEHSHVSVYGDDLIFPRAYASSVIEILEHLGFEINRAKSFLAGSFFESCGTDWFKSVNVRPFYLKGTKRDSHLPYVMQVANKLRLYSLRRTAGICCDARFQPLWISLLKGIPKGWRKCRVPDHFGDSGLISSFDEVMPRSALNGHEGWQLLFRPSRPISTSKKSFGRLLAALACPNPEISTRGREPRRGYLGLPVTKAGHTVVWPKCLSWG